ncbi:uncharacterized protein B0H18DRAFT_140681 [Fomitopsis serialis]|uniref:uncharacterized protein n=1 Tax=Fomitopsis serialis TaxID=139415 RepID=UPI002007F629|nr:uncharacterized protein B0H18DRAFT_140681 [Neoantrodia serialis]KAH9914229.1 hypothetical protein B0H18DRAFT_140681 [Neoantrodia serialis]
MFNLFSRRNALSLRRFHFTHTDADVPLLPDPAATATQATGPGSPLLELRALQDVMILQALRDVKYYAEPNILGWVNAWPRLRTLALSALVVFPETLQYIARTCPQVESLTCGIVNEICRKPLPVGGLLCFGPIGEPSGGRPALRAFACTITSCPPPPSKSAGSPASSIHFFTSSTLNAFGSRAVSLAPPAGTVALPWCKAEIEGIATRTTKCILFVD